MRALRHGLPMVIAHRGASGYRPEHTRSAYVLAIELGADAVEPDLVTTSDGVLVIRHENEISGTTDVAAHPEFAALRTTKTVEGEKLTGWFTEDFTWTELSTLRARERLPKLRPDNRNFEGEDGILRFSDLLEILDAAPPIAATGRRVGLVAEIKHASYFASIGMPLDVLFAAELARAGWDDDERLTVESFETTVLGQIRDRGIRARYIFLLEASGGPADHPQKLYADHLTPEGLAALAAGDGVPRVDGISVDKQLLLATDACGTTLTDLVDRAHAAGLAIFCWTLRAENRFLVMDLRIGTSPAAHGNWRREFELILGSGIDGVFADQADLALQVRAALAS
ncbi:MAG: glycerophosphodiester phosphodiesterase family protein [Lacisediminihabitans sp.]